MATIHVVPMTPSSDPEFANQLRVIISRLGRRLRAAKVTGDLSPTERDALIVIVGRGQIRLGELAAIEGLNPTMVSRIVGKLEAQDLATRVQDPIDRRVVHLSATDGGRALQATIRHELTLRIEHALAELTPAKQVTLKAALPVLDEMSQLLNEHPR